MSKQEHISELSRILLGEKAGSIYKKCCLLAIADAVDANETMTNIPRHISIESYDRADVDHRIAMAHIRYCGARDD